MTYAQTFLAGLALVALGVLGGFLVFHAVPQANQEPLTFILGALSGAVTTGGGFAVAHKLGGSSSPQS